MLRIDYKFKGLILNCTIKSYTITPLESDNVLKLTMRFYGVFKYNSPSKRRRDRLRREKFLAKFKSDPLLVEIPFLEPHQPPSPVTLGGPVHATIATAFTTQAEELVGEIKRLHHWCNHFAQEAEKAERERDRMCNWLLDLKD